MQWRDEGLVLGARRFGETGLILETLTATRGRRSGLVYGGAGRRKRAQYEPGNTLDLSWTARLEDQLGRFDVAELIRGRAALYLDTPIALSAIMSVTTILREVLDDGDSTGAKLYAPTTVLLDSLDHLTVWPALYARWELGLLSSLGFGLDLDQCALSGARDGLSHVSPKTGRAVRGSEAGAYLNKLFKLPAFLLDSKAAAPEDAVDDALRLTGYFLAERLFYPLNRQVPPVRQRLIDKISTGRAID